MITSQENETGSRFTSTEARFISELSKQLLSSQLLPRRIASFRISIIGFPLNPTLISMEKMNGDFDLNPIRSNLKIAKKS
jgi:hypothetical protein